MRLTLIEAIPASCDEGVNISSVESRLQQLRAEGQTVMIVAVDDKVAGLIGELRECHRRFVTPASIVMNLLTTPSLTSMNGNSAQQLLFREGDSNRVAQGGPLWTDIIALSSWHCPSLVSPYC